MCNECDLIGTFWSQLSHKILLMHLLMLLISVGAEEGLSAGNAEGKRREGFESSERYVL